MPPGRYELAGREVLVDADSVRLPDGTLAGSVLPLDRAVRNLAVFAGIEPDEARRAATEVPARLLGLAPLP
jgi:N-acetylglucosamine-6-phosphate deacetylase